ncbi:hypothetical protein PHAVU_004G110700 [Phaseolus vulgaris]|uniref:AN1-type domain-containing protein n=1 Tax=Phaseolus vulgaris TaxID=3885 RepID=V7C4B8_PHAVU|nr:hypothetical protein PHAVU_004G110700g [Phaseolus vulgaris]ESW24203.1 hypothetical protein PHAVU_004G110700g [Phaseolus vulgaris]
MVTSLCANGCEFNDSLTNKNLCSKSYNDYLKENNTKSKGCKGVECETNMNNKKNYFEVTSSISKSSTSSIIDDMTFVFYMSKKNERKRCNSCKKRIGLLEFQCRCGDVFCGSHRYLEMHACKIDCKKIGREVLIKENPLCISDKLKHRI